MTHRRTWRLLGPDGVAYESSVAGLLGGHRRTRVYGRLDCRAALAALRRGGDGRHRVFFATDLHAIAAGYRPCSVCLPDEYRRWRDAGAPNGPRRSRR